MYDDYLLPAVLVALGIAAIYAFFLFRKNRQQVTEALRDHQNRSDNSFSTKQLQLQAYERLILLADRIALPNIITRLGANIQGTSKEMQILLVQSIRQEYEYNITQQIYVSKESWEAITNLKEQNILIINQVASFLPADSTAADLNKALLEMLVNHPKASLHQIVMEILNFEAKKVFQ